MRAGRTARGLPAVDATTLQHDQRARIGGRGLAQRGGRRRMGELQISGQSRAARRPTLRACSRRSAIPGGYSSHPRIQFARRRSHPIRRPFSNRCTYPMPAPPWTVPVRPCAAAASPPIRLRPRSKLAVPPTLNSPKTAEPPTAARPDSPSLPLARTLYIPAARCPATHDSASL